ncbi:DUF6491 family protein [Sphingomonas endolithica]|uniref:DUF6491 family protein n=1 Tax=Sphingomonas endolithica TaxID=2972485 RepID=UPI0021AFCE0A|nr:DUF6491 family protein [Sphingomonas sp. ZFBP2030]
MRILLLAPIALLAVATGADSQSRPDELARATAGRIAGKPVSCVDPRLVDGPTVVGKQTLIYRQGRGRVWVNTLPEECLGLRFNAVPVVEMLNGEMCRNDSFTPVSPGAIPGGRCRLGSFTPYDRPKR